MPMAPGLAASDRMMYDDLPLNLFESEPAMEKARQVIQGIRPQRRRGGAHCIVVKSPSKMNGFDLVMKLTSCSPEILSELLLTRLDMKNSGATQGLDADFQITSMTRPLEINENVHLYRIRCCGRKQEDVLKIELEAELEYDAVDVKPRKTVLR